MNWTDQWTNSVQFSSVTSLCERR